MVKHLKNARENGTKIIRAIVQDIGWLAIVLGILLALLGVFGFLHNPIAPLF